MERHAHWATLYDPIARAARSLVPYSYTDEAYALFPRYILDGAVLEQIGTIDFDALPDVETLRTQLVEAAKTAGVQSTSTDIAKRAVAEERAALAEAFASCDVSATSEEPMPYMRVLSLSEIARVREQMADAWGADTLLYPMRERTHPSLIAFDLKYSDEAALQAEIIQFISGRGMGRIFEIREYGASYELEPAREDFVYNGAEGFWTSKAGEWVIYCSHEASITFGGSIAEVFRVPRYEGGLIGTQPGSWWKAEG